MAQLRWGIEQHLAVAISARKLADAEQFAKKHGLAKAYEGYEALAKDAEIDAVYIGAINPAHYEIGRLMLDHGKHVLCEKPLCINEGQSKRLLAHAQAKKLFFMEAIWSRFFPSYIQLRDRLNAGELGDIQQVDVSFGFPLADVDRLRMKQLGGGTVLDLGVYTIQVILWAFRAAPTKIVATEKLNEDGVDLEVSAELHFANGGIARMKTSALEKQTNTATVRGSKGTMTKWHNFAGVSSVRGRFRTTLPLRWQPGPRSSTWRWPSVLGSWPTRNSLPRSTDWPKPTRGTRRWAKDAEIDAVYIGAINPAHYEIGRLMLDHGKHVLCEKPLCINEGQSKRLLAHAQAKKLFFMEAIWSRFFPSYIQLRDRLNAGELGDIQQVDVSFGFPLADVDRLRMKQLGGGTVLDLGVYTIQVILWAFRAAPTKIVAKGKLNEDGVDLEVSAELHFANGGIARMKTSALEKQTNTATVRGSKGTMTVSDCTYIDGSRKEYTLPEGARHPFNFQNSCGLRYEAEEVRQCIAGGRLESASVPHIESLLIARIQDEIRRQIGVQFPEDAEFKV
ncbi:hypothetical protein quinque_010393 [Culex quinquefasciatus]